uniref:G-protein coupled receptors family 2 profile 1 domain-containing protein n=1 Tax=Poecilia reticulata TaxID=8081 RepID=A0A3P9PQ29_POERE
SFTLHHYHLYIYVKNGYLKLCLFSFSGSAVNYCNATWDGWLCWEDTEPGTTEQNCPDYFKDFDTRGEFLWSCRKRTFSD